METQYGEGDAAKSQSIAENYITRALSVSSAVTKVPRPVCRKCHQGFRKRYDCSVGFDKSDAILNLIEDGYLHATMAQNPDVMGYEGVKAAIRAINGRGSWRRSNRYRCIRIDKRREINKAQCNVRPSQILRRFCALTKLTIIRKCERIRKTKTLLGNSGIREGIWG